MSGEYRAGIDVGGTKCLGVLIDAAGDVVASERHRTPVGPDALLDAISGMAEALGSFSSLGVGVPGLVTADGVLRAAPNLVDVVELPIGSLLAERFGAPVMVDNDNTCATYAEWKLGAGVGTTDMVLVGLGTGIGGGIVAGSALQRGRHGFAGELGHMVVEATGVHCVCGRRGCWERYASGSGLARLAQEMAVARKLPGVVALADGDPLAVRGEHVIAAAREGDDGALTVVDDYARWVALGIVNLVNITDPEMVVIGGGLADAADIVAGPIRSHMLDLLYSSDQRPHPELEVARLGVRSGAIGAALLGAPNS